MNKRGVVWSGLILIAAVTIFVIIFYSLQAAVVARTGTVSQGIRLGSSTVTYDGQFLAMLQTPFDGKPLVRHLLDKDVFDVPVNEVENELHEIFEKLLEWDRVCVRIAVDSKIISKDSCDGMKSPKFYSTALVPTYYGSEPPKSEIDIRVYGGRP